MEIFHGLVISPMSEWPIVLVLHSTVHTIQSMLRVEPPAWGLQGKHKRGESPRLYSADAGCLGAVSRKCLTCLQS